ncbi:MAG: PKD domain-containing protein [Thermoleophilia bacterium]|nr:PKD domain-containing protein [Thermoleophilia bacterium]
MKRRLKLATIVAGALAALAVPAAGVGALIPVTVTITQVDNKTAGDFPTGEPDFFTRINIDNGSWFQSGSIFDSPNITPGWSHTVNVSTTRNLGRTPVRFEILDFNGSVFGPDLVDVDATEYEDLCPGGLFNSFGCAILTINRPQFDDRGIDITLDVRTGSVTPVFASGDVSTLTGCTEGNEGEAARVCYAITLGAPQPEELRVTKTADTNDGICSAADCSLREALDVAESGDVVVLRDLGQPYRLTYRDWDGLPPPDPSSEPGHLKITEAVEIRGPATGATIEQTRGDTRVFDIYSGASLKASNLTLTGGHAGETSTAVSSHIHGGAIHAHGDVTLENVTITGNFADASTSAAVGGGGGLFVAGGVTARLTNVTVAGNDSLELQGADGPVPGGGGIAGAGTVVATNTLIANNTGASGAGANCRQPLTSAGGNVQFPRAGCGSGIPVAASSPIATFPALGIFEPLPGSAAVDAGLNAPCPARDQIDGPRPLDGNGDGNALCDAGAVEYDPTGLGVIHQPLDSSTGQRGPVTVTFANVLTAGTTALATSALGPAPPTGFLAGVPALFYDVSTSAIFSGDVGVCVDYTGRAFANESALDLFHWDGTSWQTITTSLDTGANRACGTTSSLSPFALFENAPPTVTVVSPADGAHHPVSTTVALTATFSDPGPADTHTCTVDWDDGGAAAVGTVTPAAGGGRCESARTLSAAGVYTVRVTVLDGDGGAGVASILVVVFDRDAGYVTAGGSIHSPAGAYRPGPALAGRGDFGFTARYVANAGAPAGKAEFQFKAARLNFHSAAYRWLVLSGAKAQLRGTGTVNGSGSYGFLLTVTDGQRPGGGGVDAVRLKIWRAADGTVVYDNVLAPSATDDLDHAQPQPLADGSVVVHPGR